MGGTQHVYVAPEAHVSGDVELGEYVSVWPCAVLRGDVAPIRVGERTNIQDGAVLHGAAGHPVIVGDDVTIGHRAIVHGCTVGDRSLIGMGAIVLNGAVIGEDCLIGAGSLVTEGTHIPPHSVAFGSPARVARAIEERDRASIEKGVCTYVDLARAHIKAASSEAQAS